MALGSEELDEVVPLALGSDGASDAVARIEEREDCMATTRSVRCQTARQQKGEIMAEGPRTRL
jgi:hypothetical protein